MKIAISSYGTTPDSLVCHSFCCAPYFIIYDMITGAHDYFVNISRHNSENTGNEIARKLVMEDVKIVLTGHCGPTAFHILYHAGVNVITGITGTVHDAFKTMQYDALYVAEIPEMLPHDFDHEQAIAQ